jgi:hypothetical protein
MRTMILAATLAVAAMAAPAFADTVWTATPAQPSTQTGFPAGNVIWDCDQSGCRTGGDTTVGDDRQACSDLVRTVGPVTSFTGNKPFSADALAKCNKYAAKSGH